MHVIKDQKDCLIHCVTNRFPYNNESLLCDIEHGSLLRVFNLECLPCPWAWPTLAMASYLILPVASTWTVRALDEAFLKPMERGYCATCTSGKAPPSPKSCSAKKHYHQNMYKLSQILALTEIPEKGGNVGHKHYF